MLSFVVDEEVVELGYWDDVRQHPYGLRWDELQALCASWEKAGVISRDMSLALLVGFVGFGGAEKALVGPRIRSLRAALVRLAGFSDDEALQLARNAVLCKDEYAWDRDEHGWCFSADYSCYSLRNADHRGTEAKSFRSFEHDLSMLISESKTS